MNLNHMFLSNSELAELTKRSRPSAQISILKFMGIEHRTRPDGSLVVLRKHVELSLGCNSNSSSINNEPQPNWSAI